MIRRIIRRTVFIIPVHVVVNIDNRVGAVGFVPRFAGNLYPVTLLRVNEETGEPIRGPEGFCIPCKPGTLIVTIFFRLIKQSMISYDIKYYMNY